MAALFGKKKYNYGIALGGGGARGYAHLGVLQALEEKGIKPDILSGTSAGAIAGAFIASGKTPREAFELFKKQKLSHFVEIKMPKTGLINLDKLRDILAKNIQFDDLKELEIPLYVAVSNIKEGKVEYFDKGPLVKLVQASASIPVLFAPVELDGKLYSDGGLFDNVPVEPLKGKCRKIIAVNISPVNKTDKVKNLIQIAARTFQLSVNSTTRGLEDNCDLVIAPPDLEKFEILDASKADEIYKVGYEYCKSMKIDL